MADYWPMRILVVVKTYPTPSQAYGETVCCAGVDLESGTWVRMYPITFRRLAARFRKFEIIECRVTYPRGDHRPESRRVDQDTINRSAHIGTGQGWRRRLELLPPLFSSMEAVLDANKSESVSIAAFRPKRVTRLIIEAAKPWSERQLTALRQRRLQLGDQDTVELRELEHLPYEFSYRFVCEDERCRGNHEMRILDWEIGAAYRKWSKQYPADWRERLREKFERELPSKDLILVVGTMARHPKTFVIIGLVYPPRPKVDGVGIQQTLDLMGEQRPVARRGVLLEAQQTHTLGRDEGQQTLDLGGGSAQSDAIAGTESLPVRRQRSERPRGAKRGKG